MDLAEQQEIVVKVLHLELVVVQAHLELQDLLVLQEQVVQLVQVVLKVLQVLQVMVVHLVQMVQMVHQVLPEIVANQLLLELQVQAEAQVLQV
jgi:hypothetical protein